MNATQIKSRLMSCTNKTELQTVKENVGQETITAIWANLTPTEKKAIHIIANTEKTMIETEPKEPKQTSKLWELSHELLKLQQQIEEALENEDQHQAEQIFKDYLEIEEGFESKIENVVRFIRHQEAVAQARKEEAKRLSELAKESEREADRMREYLINHMVRVDKKKIETDYCKVSLRKKPAELIIAAEVDELPEELTRIKREPNKTAIKEAVKKNEIDKSLAYMSTNIDYSLTIK